MDSSVIQAAKAAINRYSEYQNVEQADLPARVEAVLGMERPFMEKMKEMDALLDDFPHFEELRELLFDLLMMHFFSSDVERLEGDYLESDEWEAIEDQTIDRGTELLNLLLYIRECKDEDITLELDDFLKEFLLVDEDEFQDEHRIYEPLIENQLLVESDYNEIARIARSLDPEQEIAELFYPVMSFFNEPLPTDAQQQAFARESANPAFDVAVYTLLSTYSQT